MTCCKNFEQLIWDHRADVKQRLAIEPYWCLQFPRYYSDPKDVKLSWEIKWCPFCGKKLEVPSAVQ